MVLCRRDVGTVSPIASIGWRSFIAGSSFSHPVAQIANAERHRNEPAAATGATSVLDRRTASTTASLIMLSESGVGNGPTMASRKNAIDATHRKPTTDATAARSVGVRIRRSPQATAVLAAAAEN